MTDLRKAAEMALEALEYYQEQTRPIHKTQETIAALRQALAQPERECVLAEREACAKLCEQTYDKQIVQYPKGYYVDPNKMGEYSEQTAKRCAVAIRGRTA